MYILISVGFKATVLQSICSTDSLSVSSAFLKLLLGWLGSKGGFGSSCRYLTVQGEYWEGPW